MKKISMILFAAVMAVSFASCGAKTEENKTEDAATTTETAAPATEQPAAEAGASASADEFIANYEKFLNEMLPIMEKVSKGDNAAIQDYQKFSEQGTQLAADAQKYIPNFTPEQAKKWQDMATKYADAVQKMTKK